MVQTGADHFDGYHDLLDDGRRRLSRRRERAVPPRAPIPQMLAGQLLGHPRRNFGLHGEQILGLAIELIRPECLFCAGIDQRRTNPDPAAIQARTPFHYCQPRFQLRAA
jgi:hypothetical protein